MTSKEFLDRPYHIKKKIRYLELELDRYKVMMNSIPQPSYGTVRVDKTPSGETPNQKALEKYYETEDKIAEKKAELERVIAEITTVIDMNNKLAISVIFFKSMYLYFNNNL